MIEAIETRNGLLARIVKDLTPRLCKRAYSRGYAHCEDDVCDFLQDAMIKIYPIVDAVFSNERTFSSYTEMLCYCSKVGYNAMSDRQRSINSKLNAGVYKKSREKIAVKVFSLTPVDSDQEHDLPAVDTIDNYINQQHFESVTRKLLDTAKKCKVTHMDMVVERYYYETDTDEIRESLQLSAEQARLFNRQSKTTLKGLAQELGFTVQEVFE